MTLEKVVVDSGISACVVAASVLAMLDEKNWPYGNLGRRLG